MYTELHLHTSFSFLDGASQPDELIRRAQDLGYTSLAITDHDGLHGALEFAQLADAAGIQPITGAEITLADGSHLTLLAETPTGYGNLCRVLTHIHHGRRPAPVALPGDAPPDHELNPPLGDYAEGVILLTGCRDGQLSRAVAGDNMRDAASVLNRYIEWFGRDNVFVELQQNEVFGDTARIRALVGLADAAGVGYVATSDVHYHAAARHQLQDVLVAIRNRTTLDGCHRERRPNARFALPTHAEMARRFADWPDAIANTQVIARRCEAFRLTRDLKYTFPDYDAGTGETPDEALARICWETFEQRYHPDNEDAKARVREELRLIARHNLSGFFLIYRDLLELAREVAAELRGGPVSGSRRFLPPGRGRGSSVSSVVCYLIGLSPVDPLAHDLYVGRFLNEELPSIPDIDLDFPREIRERLIERVYDVYGADHAALVCAFSTYRLRSAVRDVGKALGLPLADLDRIARLSEPRSADSLAEELEHLPEYAARRATPPWSYLIELAKQLAGFPRHVTQHVGGMIVSASPLNEIVPIQPAAMEGRFMCQWDKDSCEDARFIKIDFLALGMLSLVEEALDLIDATGTEIDLSRIDFNDPAVYEMIQAGDTVGVFQVESRAQIQMLRRTLPTRLDDLVVQVAIVRPGPIVGGAVTPYVQRRENPDYVPEYDHPRLEKLLKETLGVILYQEQVVQVAEELAGFSAGQADQLRRAMTRKRSTEAMEAMRTEFIAGCLAQGDVAPEVAEGVFDKLTGFAEYGFPKSHAAAFALLAYQSCWLKHYYPAEFLCALLNNQPMGFYAPHVLVNDARRHGIRVLRPDVNASTVPCSVEGRRTVRVGLAFVKGLGEDAASAIARERALNGNYRSLADLVRRVPLRAEAVRHLIAAGACDGFGMQRREMIWQLGLFIPSKSLTKGRSRHKTAGRQLSLALPTEQDMTELPRTSAWERMADEYRILGMSTTFHPMALLRSKMPWGMVSTRDLSSMRDGAMVRLPGLIVCRQRPGTAKGITFLLLEDEFDLVNVVVHPWLYEKQRHHVRATPLLVIHGRVQHAKNNINIVAESVQPIEDMQLVYPYDGRDPQRGHPLEQPDGEVNPGTIELVQLDDRREDGPRRRSDIRSVSPDSHNYR